MSSSTENKDSTNTPTPTAPQTQNTTDTNSNNYYERKKNIISGIDNGHLGVGLGITALAVGVFASIPLIKDAWERFVNRPPPPPQIQGPPIVEPEQYIEPTPPLPPVPNNNGHAQQEQQEAPQPQQEKQEEEPDGLFHEAELRRKQKLMGQRPRGNRYESPFGKDIGGL